MDVLFELLVILLSEADKESRKQHLRYLRDTTSPFDVEENIFQEFFRLPKELAKDLIDELEQHNDETSDIPFALRVLSALHFLGHGSYQRSIASNYLLPMSQPSVSRNISHICQLMVSNMAYKVKFCQDQESKNAIKEGFYNKYGIKGVIGAIDCSHVGIVAPPIHDPERPARLYLNRKGYYSINMEAIVDSNLKFLSVNAKYPGSVHDSAIWQTTPARIHLIRQHHSNRYNWLIGDSGYPLEPWLLTPFSELANNHEETFNLKQVKARNTVERAFGVLKNRFRCLNKCRTLHYSPDKAGMIIYSCTILHNMLIDCGVTDNPDALIIYDEEADEFRDSVNSGSNYLTEGRRIRSEYASTL